jgi:hypothetical protein
MTSISASVKPACSSRERAVILEQQRRKRQACIDGARVELFPHPVFPDVRTVIEAWPNLPSAVRAGIVAMVRVAANFES